METKEQVIQVAVTRETQHLFGDVFILTNRGRLFVTNNDLINNGEWRELKLPDFNITEYPHNNEVSGETSDIDWPELAN